MQWELHENIRDVGGWWFVVDGWWLVGKRNEALIG
jgi:hypothetical protein